MFLRVGAILSISHGGFLLGAAVFGDVPVRHLHVEHANRRLATHVERHALDAFGFIKNERHVNFMVW